MPAKNSKANFWRLRFTRPLRAGKRANANFACSEGFFCARCAAPCAGLVVLARPAAVVAAFVYGAPAFFCRYAAALFPACGLSDTSALGLVCAAAACLPCACARVYSEIALAFFRLTFASQISFHLSLRPRRASTFFRKESRQRFAKGLRPFEPHFCALRPIFSSSALLAGLRGLSGRKPPAGRETLEKPRSRAQLFKRFCAKGDACALSPISPFLSLLAGLSGPSAANRRLAWETPEKPRSKAQLFGRFCAWGYVWPPRFAYSWKFGAGFRPVGFLPGRREQEVGFLFARENRSPAWAHTRKESRACEAGHRHKPGARIARRRHAAGRLKRPFGRKPPAGRETPEKPRSRAQLFGRFCAWGNGWPHVLRIHGSLARAFSLPGRTGAQRGPTPGKNRGRARLGADTNPVRDLLTAGVRRRVRR